MNVDQFLEFAHKSGQADRHDKGQVTLGYLRDMLALLPADMPCRYDTGHNFGLLPVDFKKVEEYKSAQWHCPEHDTAFSKTAYPSCYRGYYSDCTFNAKVEYCLSSVGHVLSLVDGAIGKTFDGYKGGLNSFSRSTFVWGGSTSHSSTGNSEMVIGFELVSGVCVITTKTEDI